MTKPTTPKSATPKRRTRAQLDERLSTTLGPKRSIKAILKEEPAPPDPASRQRIRDRAGD